MHSLDVRGPVRCVGGAGWADVRAHLLDLCVACDRGRRRERALRLLCAGQLAGWLTRTWADPDGHICAGERRAV